jgi:mannonate dehydratase
MDRRDFSRSLALGAAGAAVVGASTSSPATAQSAQEQLTPRRNTKIRVGGDYHTTIGDGGPTSKQSLEYHLRFGVKHLTVNFTGSAGDEPGSRPAGPNVSGGGFLRATGPWDLDNLKRMQDNCSSVGMKLEGIRMDSAYIVMQPGPDRDRYLDLIMENVRRAGEAGVEVISYHWTMIPIRRNRRVPGRGGVTYSGFTLEDDWQNLPPTEAAGRVSLDDYWERITYFLDGVIPVARESNVKMAVHPYDPGGLPLGYQGVDNWDAVDYVAALKRYELAYDDVYNGFQYDTGVAGESLMDPNSQLEVLRYLVERGKVHQIHFRNIRGRQNDFVEVYHDEGDVNLFDVVRLLRDLDWEGSLLPDHSPRHPDDPGSLQGFAFANGYITGLIRAANEEVG